MLFSSTIFIFLFLAAVIVAYYGFRPEGRNYYLLAASIFFYAWGEPKFVIVMLLSSLFNYAAGLFIDKFREEPKLKKTVLVIAVAANVGLLFVYKYLGFTVEIINSLFNRGLSSIKILLPIGISFFTFQGMSYVIDVYRATAKVQKNPFYLALYISFFPQLIAGPIVRYNTIAEQIDSRECNIDMFSDGVRRFIIGLSKKVLIANSLAVVADKAFDMGSSGSVSVAMAWMGAFAYAFQIFFDFCGYSEMAIGLGKMFGFTFLENFNYPYIASSVKDFWRRWHISLGSWFRDYVYIPMGGSRVNTKAQLVFNLFVVWLLTGVWHGANFTFVVWGLWYFLLLSFEKLTGLPDKLKSGLAKFLYRIFTLSAVLFGWVVFRADNLAAAVNYFSLMFGGANVLYDYCASFYLREYFIYYIFAFLLSTPIFKVLKDKLFETKLSKVYQTVSYMAYIGLFLLSVAMLIMDSYNPFIYFNF